MCEVIKKMEADRLNCLKAASKLTKGKQSYYLSRDKRQLIAIKSGRYKKHVSDRELELLEALDFANKALREAAKHLKVKQQARITGMTQRQVEYYHYINQGEL